jgi:uncharacterized membrane protein YfcA
MTIVQETALFQAVALFIAAIFAGALNSVAGGGSFISFPMLLFTGVPAIQANATNAMAVWPGSMASIPPYRKDLAHERRELLIFSAVSIVGGVLGAIILLRTPPALFQRLVPWLLLLATLIFAFGGTLTQRLRRGRADATDAQAEAAPPIASAPDDTASEAHTTPRALAVVGVIQFVIAFYGGFFGGGMGIMMLAGFALLGMRNIHAMNALKVVLASIINGVAVIAFTIAGAIAWPQALVMVVGAIIGGYYGAALAHRVPPQYVRWFAIAVGLLISAYFFIKQGL